MVKKYLACMDENIGQETAWLSFVCSLFQQLKHYTGKTGDQDRSLQLQNLGQYHLSFLRNSHAVLTSA